MSDIDQVNVDVKCDKPGCGPTFFTTSLDSFCNKAAACPKCERSDFVYMVNEDGQPIHPTERCPECGKPALLRERCRCAYYCIKCSEGHKWHTCQEHKILVMGNPHLEEKPYGKCTCSEAVTA